MPKLLPLPKLLLCPKVEGCPKPLELVNADDPNAGLEPKGAEVFVLPNNEELEVVVGVPNIDPPEDLGVVFPNKLPPLKEDWS